MASYEKLIDISSKRLNDSAHFSDIGEAYFDDRYDIGHFSEAIYGHDILEGDDHVVLGLAHAAFCFGRFGNKRGELQAVPWVLPAKAFEQPFQLLSHTKVARDFSRHRRIMRTEKPAIRPDGARGYALHMKDEAPLVVVDSLLNTLPSAHQDALKTMQEALAQRACFVELCLVQPLDRQGNREVIFF